MSPWTSPFTTMTVTVSAVTLAFCQLVPLATQNSSTRSGMLRPVAIALRGVLVPLTDRGHTVLRAMRRIMMRWARAAISLNVRRDFSCE